MSYDILTVKIIPPAWAGHDPRKCSNWGELHEMWSSYVYSTPQTSWTDL